jgi:cation diffusion facilitator CzcD-associated flavoprotein CzcO
MNETRLLCHFPDMAVSKGEAEHVDVLIVGAGISGVDALAPRALTKRSTSFRKHEADHG